MSLTVVKLGGQLLEGESLATVCADIATLTGRGDRMVVVHGGGPQATAMQKRLGIEPNIVAGRRITDSDTLEIMKMVVGGRLNMNLCAALVAAGVNAVGLTGASSTAIRASKRPARVVVGGGPDPVDFGWVGDVEGVNDELISRLLDGGYVPVMACLGGAANGDIFNINGDVVANYVASSLAADHLLLVTSVPGVLRDIDDPDSRIRTMTANQVQAAIDEGVVSGGMIPKVAESVAGLERGIGAVHIVGGLGPGQLISELDEPGSVGTAFVSERTTS